MSDLLSQENVDQFRAAIRSITDTFHKTPVILRTASGADVNLLAGDKPDDVGSYGEIHGEVYVQEERRETEERRIVTFNRDYLIEQGLVDPATDELLFDSEDWIIIKGKRFAIVKLTDKAIFRGLPILVQLTVQR